MRRGGNQGRNGAGVVCVGSSGVGMTRGGQICRRKGSSSAVVVSRGAAVCVVELTVAGSAVRDLLRW